MSTAPSRSARAFARTAVWLIGLSQLAGCGSSNPPTVAVRGVVTFNGSPVEGASVVFTRGSGNLADGEIAIGKTDANGRFELITHFGSQASSKGAVPGTYSVTISKHVPPKGMTQAEYQAKVDAANKIGETGAIAPKELRPPELVEMFPPHYSAAGTSRLSATVAPKGANDLTFALD